MSISVFNMSATCDLTTVCSCWYADAFEFGDHGHR